VSFDADRLEISGSSVPIVPNLPTFSFAGKRQPYFAVSASGSLAYVAGEPDESRHLAVINRNGIMTPMKDRSIGLRPRFAPGGALVAVDDADAQIWIHDLKRGGIRMRLTSGALHYVPVWSPDGRHIAFSSYKSHLANLAWILTNDPNKEEQLVKEGNRQYPSSFSPDGQLLAYTEVSEETRSDIWVVRVNPSLTTGRVEHP
jgi:Tol biopolymer transport system component